jgi:hypothetical protein
MRTFGRAIVAAAALVVAFGGAALAQHDDHGHDSHGHDDHGHGGHDDHWHGDLKSFHDHDFDRWRGGGWIHGRHDGRQGWWWVVGPQWYFYPAPVYPYPDPYVPPVMTAPVAAPSWYYCANPPGYYPYVARCAVPWQPVPAQ